MKDNLPWVFTNTVDLSKGNKGQLNIFPKADGNNMSVRRGLWWSIVRVRRCGFTASCVSDRPTVIDQERQYVL